MYSLHQENKITKTVYNNIMNSIKLLNRMDIIFMNFKKSKKSDSHRLLLNLKDAIDLKRSDKYVAFTIHGKIWKVIQKQKI